MHRDGAEGGPQITQMGTDTRGGGGEPKKRSIILIPAFGMILTHEQASDVPRVGWASRPSCRASCPALRASFIAAPVSAMSVVRLMIPAGCRNRQAGRPPYPGNATRRAVLLFV